MINLFSRTYYPLNRIIISKEAVVSNYRHLMSKNKNIQVAPVLKSNAYGHGIVHIAKILDDQNAPMFCVDSLYEAYELLKANVKTHILIMGYINTENLKVKKLPFSYAVYDLKTLQALNDHQKGAQVHIKVDTGMHRLGVPMDELEDFIKKAKSCTNVQIVGLMSHLASADDMVSTQNLMQIENFKKAKKIAESLGLKLKWKHLVASDGLINLASRLSRDTNMARVGLAIYGISSNDDSLKPALTLTSQIVQVKKIQKGATVGYSATFKASKDTTIGILPIGYNDGVDRRLSNIGVVKVKNRYCQILGRVSKNITEIDITEVVNPKVGDRVTIYSNSKKDLNSIQNAAKLCKTI